MDEFSVLCDCGLMQTKIHYMLDSPTIFICVASDTHIVGLCCTENIGRGQRSCIKHKRRVFDASKLFTSIYNNTPLQLQFSSIGGLTEKSLNYHSYRAWAIQQFAKTETYNHDIVKWAPFTVPQNASIKDVFNMYNKYALKKACISHTNDTFILESVGGHTQFIVDKKHMAILKVCVNWSSLEITVTLLLYAPDTPEETQFHVKLFCSDICLRHVIFTLFTNIQTSSVLQHTSRQTFLIGTLPLSVKFIAKTYLQ